jgi:hypothetical protein
MHNEKEQFMRTLPKQNFYHISGSVGRQHVHSQSLYYSSKVDRLPVLRAAPFEICQGSRGRGIRVTRHCTNGNRSTFSELQGKWEYGTNKIIYRQNIDDSSSYILENEIAPPP